MEGSEQESGVKCHCVKCCRAKVIKMSTIRSFTNGIKENFPPNIVWFEDEPKQS